MNNKLEILKMVAEGQMSAEEALPLLEAINQSETVEDVTENFGMAEEKPSFDSGATVKNLEVALIACRLNVEKSNVSDVTVEILDAQTRELVPKPDWLIFSEEGQWIRIMEKRPQSINDLFEFIKNSSQMMKTSLFINIKLPMDVVLDEAELSSVSGHISMIGIKGMTLHLKSVSGNLQLTQVKGVSIQAKTTSGNVIAEEVTCSSGLYKTTSGKIKIKGIHTKATIKNISGGIRYDEAGDVQSVDVGNVSGSIEIRVKTPERYNLSLDTVSGGIDTSGFAVVDKQKNGKKSVAVHNRSEGYSIHASTISGKIILDSLL